MAWSQTWSKSVGMKNGEILEWQTWNSVRENYWKPYFVTVKLAVQKATASGRSLAFVVYNLYRP